MTAATEGSICIIDDDADVRNSLRALLSTHDFQVLDFPSADAYLASAQSEAIACFLLDVQMPGTTGVELLEHLRDNGVKTPAIFLTANGTTRSSRFARAGVIAVLRKPVSDEELLKHIRVALAGG